MTNEQPAASPLPSLSWEQVRLLQHAMARSALPKFDEVRDDVDLGSGWLHGVEAPYRRRAKYFNQFGPCYAQLGALPGELRLSIEPMHPLPDADRTALVGARLREFGVSNADDDYGLGVLSRAWFKSLIRHHAVVRSCRAPASHTDIFLFDPLVGFLLWSDG